MSEAIDLLREAQLWWDSARNVRRNYELNQDYFRSLQWGTIWDPEQKKEVPEDEYYARKGLYPYIFNVFGTIVRNILGQFRQNRAERRAFAVSEADDDLVEAVNILWRYVRRRNMSAALEADGFIDHMLAGLSVWKTTAVYSAVTGREEVQEYLLKPHRIAFNLDLHDRRMTNLRLIAELHDLTIDEFLSRFATSRQHARELEEHIQVARTPKGLAQVWGAHAERSRDFLYPVAADQVRVIEIWDRTWRWVRFMYDPVTGTSFPVLDEEMVNEEQQARAVQGVPLLEDDGEQYLPSWRVRFLLPDGYLLDEIEQPFEHGEHPYTITLASWVANEPNSPLSDVRDPQKWINRQLMLIEYFLRSSAKGALAVDATSLEESGLTLEEVARWYTSPDAVLAFRTSPNQGRTLSNILHAIQSTQMPAGFLELFPLMINFLERISGISEAARGVTPKSGTPAALYQQQVLQSTINIADILEAYLEGLELKDRKTLKLILEVYRDEMKLRDEVTGRVITYSPEKIRKLELDVAIGSVANTITERVFKDQFLLQLWQAGAIPTELLLEEVSLPSGRRLLDRLRAMLQQAAAQTTPQPAAAGRVAQQLMQQLGANGNGTAGPTPTGV